jgi:DNA ligase-1
VTLFAAVVAASDAAAATTKRTAKVAALGALLRQLERQEVRPAIGFLTGAPRQGRIGVGWATMAGLEGATADEARLSVSDVDAALSRLALTAGSGSVAARAAILRDLFGRATAAEAWFLRRLLVGELRQGALEGVMTDAVAKAAAVPIDSVRRAAMFSGDLGRAADAALTGGEAALAAIGLTVLQPVQPMLAATAGSVAEALSLTGPASVEWKLDGARIQVHRLGDGVRVFTRNLNEITDRLPQVVAAVRRFPSERLVLDGEALGVDGDGRPHLFQDTMSRFGADQPGVAVGLQVGSSTCSTPTAPISSTARWPRGWTYSRGWSGRRGCQEPRPTIRTSPPRSPTKRSPEATRG